MDACLRYENRHFITRPQAEKRHADGRKQRNLRGIVPEFFRIDKRTKSGRVLPVEPVAHPAARYHNVLWQNRVFAKQSPPELSAEEWRKTILVPECFRDHSLQWFLMGPRKNYSWLCGNHVDASRKCNLKGAKQWEQPGAASDARLMARVDLTHACHDNRK